MHGATVKTHIPYYIEISCRFRYGTCGQDIPLYALVGAFTNNVKTDELLLPGYIRINGKNCALQKQSLNEGKVTSLYTPGRDVPVIQLELNLFLT